MEPNNLSPEQATELKDELSALSKKHFQALERAVYISMNEEEADKYAQSGVRISELYGLLGKLVA
jgi:phenylpyruvate tautomerase PptA (4-oxalocrotonate tautomerase family)